ncbi:protein phosphatase 2C-like protein [Pseudoduganella flava]|uniref:Protein phosphatase 2C-like protein n=1 Tax=Pseudoduganella flava TaxID=871742 RepID=A0A562PZZ7_9BURK|nr:protein phosphatase 2C domain-containing protein [Pseudoduganella flava]QGZ38463.1 hypothetical protein GO485_04945 [Pseudoduganella flava]TWI49987.1 protein phosphatase 2C-like protein [Pseudoduganella flava]
MQPDVVCQGALPHHNEDHIAVFETAGVTDLIVLDGATSVADRNYADAAGDVAWFVRRFSAALGPAIKAGLDQHAAVHAAIGTVRTEFAALTAGSDVPAHAWPIAALTWIRIAGRQARLYCLGDCKTLLGLPDGAVRDLDPYVNPQEAVLAAEIARLNAAGFDDPAARHAALLPMLRARREQQNAMAAPTILCLHPQGPFAARRDAIDLPGGAVILGMTDGFYRLVDPYDLLTPAALMGLCVNEGLAAALARLRAYEAGASAGATVKRADDASAVLWRA